MKNAANAIKRLTTVPLMALCLFAIAIPAAATDTSIAPEDNRYGIVIECSYPDIEDSNTVNQSIYEENVFLLSSKTSELYAIAQYCEEKQTYAITGYTADENTATRFRCGTDAKLRIGGIAPDTYVLNQVETSAGYTLTFGTELDFRSAAATVNGSEMDTSIDPDTGEMIASLPITLAKGFDIPMGECGLVCWSYRTFGFDIFSTVGSVLIIGCSISLFFVIRSSRKKQPPKTQ